MIAYIITNTISRRKYIGITSRTLPRRWNEHLLSAARGCSFALHRAIRKHGTAAFTIQQVATAMSIADLLAVEVMLIAQHRTMRPKGYNMTTGGEGAPGRTPSLLTRKKLSAAHKGKTLSVEHRKKMALAKVGRKRGAMSQTHRDRIAAARMGYKFSHEARAKMSNAKKGKPWTQKRREAGRDALLLQ